MDRLRIPGLERNLLIYRALEMTQFLFHAEHLRRYVLESLASTEAFERKGEFRLQSGAPKRLQRCWKILEQDGVLSPAESEEIQKLLDYRNTIAHQIHTLTADIGPGPLAQEFLRWNGIQYDYTALKRLRTLSEKIRGAMAVRYINSMSLDGLLFGRTVKCYDEELLRLGKRISRLHERRKREVAALRREIREEREDWEDSENSELVKRPNGTLSEKGVELCGDLFSRGRSIRAVAVLLQISLSAARRRWNRWSETNDETTCD